MIFYPFILNKFNIIQKNTLIKLPMVFWFRHWEKYMAQRNIAATALNTNTH